MPGLTDLLVLTLLISELWENSNGTPYLGCPVDLHAFAGKILLCDGHFIAVPCNYLVCNHVRNRFKAPLIRFAVSYWLMILPVDLEDSRSGIDYLKNIRTVSGRNLPKN